jgi:hypothetical protein
MITVYDLRNRQDSETYEKLEDLLGESLEIISLVDNAVSKCIGCWSCWLKTPGKCVMKDNMSSSYSNYVKSNKVILLMSTSQGFLNHNAKAFFDRTIPHYLPYIELVNGECHHEARYDSYPDLVFYYEDNDLSNQEKEVVKDYLYRTAYHFKSKPYLISNDEKMAIVELTKRHPSRRNIPFSVTEKIERLIIYNGSPRRSKSNSTLILDAVHKKLGDRVLIRDLKERDKWDEWVDSFTSERDILFFMPLYVHAMPGHVMEFLEMLDESTGSISFFVQSGFPESSQSHYLEAYFEQLSVRLGRNYLGTAIKGGMESLRMMPEKSQNKKMEPLVFAIEKLIQSGEFDMSDIEKLAAPVSFNKITQFLFNVIGNKIINGFWDQQLKNNEAYNIRFERF